nr:hypothetical protein [uncultured Allomuricauda sp.]
MRIQTSPNVHKNNNTKDNNKNEVLDSWRFTTLAAVEKNVEDQGVKTYYLLFIRKRIGFEVMENFN